MTFDVGQFKRKFLQQFRILPVLIVVASLAFVVRLGDAYISMKSLSGSAYAEDAAKAEPAKTTSDATKPSTDALVSKDSPAEKTGETNPPSADKPDTKGADDSKNITLPSTDSADAKKEEKSGDTEKKWQDAADADTEGTEIKAELYSDLVKRRKDLDGKDQKLAEREALLEAAQKELNRKLKEMEGLRDEIKDLLKQQSGEEAARIQSLVKIYSGMKPKDAARIFNTLDTDILMEVISGMPESKSGAIIALMDADRAKLLTTMLAEQKKLPDM